MVRIEPSHLAFENSNELFLRRPELAPDPNPLEQVGAPAVLHAPIRHSRPMLSLEKATKPEQVEAFSELVSLGLADRIVFDDLDHAESVLGRCPVPEVVARARLVMTVRSEREDAAA